MPGGAAPTARGKAPAVRAAITPVAAVSPSVPDLSGPVVIAMERPPADFRVAQGALSAPPLPMIVNAPGALGIPMIALSAYRNAEQKMAVAAPGCGISASSRATQAAALSTPAAPRYVRSTVPCWMALCPATR
jgi:membrane-bound lytic murein transglycosylase B